MIIDKDKRIKDEKKVRWIEEGVGLIVQRKVLNRKKRFISLIIYERMKRRRRKKKF